MGKNVAKTSMQSNLSQKRTIFGTQPIFRVFSIDEFKLNVAEIMISVFSMGRKHCGKRRKCCLPGIFLPLTSAEACEKSSRWLWKEK